MSNPTTSTSTTAFGGSTPHSHTSATTPASTVTHGIGIGLGTGTSPGPVSAMAPPEVAAPREMNLVRPFIPTLEDLAIYEKHNGSRSRGHHGHSPDTGTAAALADSASTSGYAPGLTPQMQLQQPQAPSLNLRACILTAAQLQELTLPRRSFLLDRWLCQGDLGYVFAPRGVGKTWMALLLPLAISLGRALGKWKAGDRNHRKSDYQSKEPGHTPAPPKPVRVLYVDGEMPMELTQQRSNALELHQGDISYIHHESVFAANGGSLNLALPDHRAQITEVIVDQGFECVILDNLSSLTSGLDENAGIDFDPLSQWLIEFRRRKITVIIIHHAGRNGLMRGHSKREDACSWILELRDAKTEEDSGAKFITHFAKPSRNTGDTLPDLLWHLTTGEDGKVEVLCEYAAATEYEQFLAHVKDGTQRQAELAEIMNKPKSTINRWVVKALREGHLSGSPRNLLPPGPDNGKAKASKPLAYRDDDDCDHDENEETREPIPATTIPPKKSTRPPRETSFFDDAVAEYELETANAEARARMQQSYNRD